MWRFDEVAGGKDPFNAWVSSLHVIREAHVPLVMVEGSSDQKALSKCFLDHVQF